MAKRGPKPNDVAAPQVFEGVMRSPKDLDEVGRKAWSSVVNDLRVIGTLHETDAKLIELYCRTYSLFKRVETQLAQEELTLMGDRGRSFINPLLAQTPNLVARLTRLLTDLGLSSRTRKPIEVEVIDPKWKEPE